LATPVELPAPVEALKVAPIVAVKPTGEEVAVADVVEVPPAEVAAAEPAPAEPAAALPQTASNLPFVGLLGLLSLGACAGLLFLSKRIA
jgi:LPXTG-motif cell wall-anchored protein